MIVWVILWVIIGSKGVLGKVLRHMAAPYALMVRDTRKLWENSDNFGGFWWVTLEIIDFVFVLRMARGHQKIQSQAKAAEKASKMKKQQGHSANDQKKAAQKALIHVCTVCKVRCLCIG